MATITLLGAGRMSAALTVPLADNGHEIRLVGTHLDDDLIATLRATGRHPRLDVSLPDSVSPHTYDQLDDAVRDAALIVLGVNSLGLDWAAMSLSMTVFDAPIVLLTKGLVGDDPGWTLNEGTRIQTLSTALREQLAPAQQSVLIAALGGPSLAGELAARRDTFVALACPQRDMAESLAALLRTGYYHVQTSTDLAGTEVCMALKNIYAVAVGVARGLVTQAGDGATTYNNTAAIFAQSLAEMAYLVEQTGGDVRTVHSIAGAGDLFVTGQGGRNARLGEMLGQGQNFLDLQRGELRGETVEGAELALAIGPAVEALIRTGKLDGARVPLLRRMIQIILNEAPIELPWGEFFVGSF